MAYRRILAAPHVLQLTIASVVARVPVGMTGVALVIYVHDRTGSFAAAGAVAGASTVGLAMTAPVLGRLVDRRGPRPVLVPAAVVAAAALVALVEVGNAGGSTLALVLLAALSERRCRQSAGSCATSGPTWSPRSCWSTRTCSTRS